MGEKWTEEAVLRESGRWVHVPRDGRCIEDERRLLVHLPERWGTSRVWRSRAADEEQADDLIEETVGEVRAAGGRRVLWHAGDLVAPPCMDDRLARHGFRKTEDLKVLAFVLVNGQEQQLPRMRDPEHLSVELVRCAEALDEALRVDAEVFGSPPPTGGEFAEHAGELEGMRRHELGGPTDDGAPVAMRFVAHMNSPPGYEGESQLRTVAAAGAQIVGETLRLWGAGTRRAFRGRGAYSALVLERCRVGRHFGATLALAKANVATSAPILERAGFYPVGVERRYVLEIQPRGEPRRKDRAGRSTCSETFLETCDVVAHDSPERRAVIIGPVAERPEQQFSETDLAMMRRALCAAEEAAEKGEVPVGCVVARGEEVLAVAANEREATGDPTAHAELLAVRRASAALGGWRLTGCTLYATLEPCPMCAGAAHAARLSRLVFAAPDPKAGYAGTLHNTPADNRLNHTLVVQGGLLAENAAALLRDFFRNRRRKPG